MVRYITLGIFAAATLGLALLVEPVPSWYYHLAWWSYIGFLDDVNHRRSGRSLLRRPPRLAWLGGVSIAWWTLFEALNLRLGNWYYVMDHASPWVSWPAGVLAFATVLPGLVVTLTFVEDAGWGRSVHVPRLAWGPGRGALCAALGLACLVLPLAWPRYFYAVTWAWAALLLEPWNRRHARRSYLRDLEHGEAGPLLQALAAGLACGVLWEAWNYWARTRWIYTVPFFDELKLFEMPPLGFLGFPPFAVASLVLVRFLRAAGERWAVPSPARLVAWAVTAGLVTLVFATTDATVDSLYVPTRRLRALEPEVRERLADLGLVSPERVARALAAEEPRAHWAGRSGLSAERLARAQRAVRLVLHEGLGDARAVQLRALGIDSVERLGAWEPEALAAALRAADPRAPQARFLERRARVWVGSAPRPAAEDRPD
jgi:hypothetical protein